MFVPQIIKNMLLLKIIFYKNLYIVHNSSITILHPIYIKNIYFLSCHILGHDRQVFYFSHLENRVPSYFSYITSLVDDECIFSELDHRVDMGCVIGAQSTTSVNTIMPSITLTSCCNPGIFAASVPHHAVSLYTSVEYFYCFQFRLSYCLPSCSTRKDRRLLVLLFPFIERDIIPVIHL